MSKRIAYHPLLDQQNAYTARMAHALSSFGAVEAMPRPAMVMRAPWRHLRQYDILVCNWIDNSLANTQGKFSVPGLLRFVGFVLYARLIARHVVFVRHNTYPHACSATDGARIESILDWAEGLFDTAVTHSGHNATVRRRYVPHPLYHDGAVQAQATEDYFLVFGRIMPYKGIHELIAAYDGQARLVIAGPCSDDGYLSKLRALAAGRKNIEIRPTYLTEDEATTLVGRSRGVILPHPGKDMIVSGSYFFAAGLDVQVFAVDTPFLRWAKQTLGQPGIHLSDTLEALARSLSNAAGPASADVASAANRNFGSAAVADHLARALRSSGALRD